MAVRVWERNSVPLNHHFFQPALTYLPVGQDFREHNLLQAIARVNRLFEDGTTEKEFGFIVNFEGSLGELDATLTTYSAFEGFDIVRPVSSD